MVGPLEEIILSGLHTKAMDKEMNLNNYAEFKQLVAKIQQVSTQVTDIVKQVVDNTQCGCGKKNLGPITKEDIELANKNRENKTTVVVETIGLLFCISG